MRRTTHPRSSFIKPSCLQRWDTTPSHVIPPCTPAQTPRYLECPFPVNHAINNRICIWEGDITTLEVDAVIAGTNEYEPPRKSFTERVFQRGRPKEERRTAPEVGEVRVVEEPCVVANYLLYTLAPKFRPRNRANSDYELHITYRNVLERARQLGFSSLALGILNSTKKNYPPNYGAHISLRTLRRFFEHYPNVFDVVVLVVDTFTHGLYERILPLYFPRTPLEEEAACWRLPAPIGGPWGEPLTEQGEMRITENPQNIFDEEFGGLAARQIGEHPFARMEGDLDTERLLGGRHSTYSTGDPVLDIVLKDFEKRGRYERMLRQARSEDLTEISKLGCLYQSGTDRLGRPVVVFIGRWFRARETNHNKFFLYLISLLDGIVNSEYVIIYFHTKSGQENRPGMNWFTTMYNILPYKYKKNLKAVYVVHPTFWTKSLTWWFAKFLAPTIKEKIHTISGIEYLYNFMHPKDLEIPAFITEYDMSINGVHYYKPKHIESERGDFETISTLSRLRSMISESQPSTSGFGSTSRDPRPSTSVVATARQPPPSKSRPGTSTAETGPSTSGMASTREPHPSKSGVTSTREPYPSKSGPSTSTAEMRPTASEVGTSTWELRQSKTGYRFTKLEPRSSKSQPEALGTLQVGQSSSPLERGKQESRPGSSTSLAGRSIPGPQQKGPRSQPGPAKPDPESDPWKVLLSPSSSEVSLTALHSEQPLDRSRSRIKPDPWGLLPSPATSEPELAAIEPQAVPSSSKSAQPPSKPPPTKSTTSKKKGERKKRSSVSDMASTFL